MRTRRGRHLLRPVPALTQGVLGALGRALEAFPVQLHAFVYLSNHAHLLLTIARAWMLAGFLRILNKGTGDVARSINGFSGPVWGRAHNAAVLDDGASIEQLQYILANSVKEGLVDDPRHWPGPSSARALLDGVPLRGRWSSQTVPSLRTAGSTLEREYTISLAPLPCFSGLPADEQRARMRALADNAIAMAQRDRGGRPPLGIAGILAADPLAPHDLEARKRAPVAHASDPYLVLAYRDERVRWANEFHRASREFRSHSPPETFPVDAFPPPPDPKTTTATTEDQCTFWPGAGRIS